MNRDRDAARREGEAPVVDLDALLVALVLVPNSYPRNRFFSLYKDRAGQRVRRRASMLRSLIGDLAGDARGIEVVRRDGGGVTLRYELPEVGVQRVTRLDEEELALVAHIAQRARPDLDLGARRGVSERVMARLARLMP